MESKCGRPAAGYNGFIREESEVCEMKRVVSILLSALVWAHGGNVENCTANMQITAREGRRNLCDVQSLGATLPPTPWPRGSPIYRLQADGWGEAYVQTHAVIDGILPGILIAAVLPLFRLKNAARSGESGRARAATFSHSSCTRWQRNFVSDGFFQLFYCVRTRGLRRAVQRIKRGGPSNGRAALLMSYGSNRSMGL